MADKLADVSKSIEVLDISVEAGVLLQSMSLLSHTLYIKARSEIKDIDQNALKKVDKKINDINEELNLYKATKAIEYLPIESRDIRNIFTYASKCSRV